MPHVKQFVCAISILFPDPDEFALCAGTCEQAHSEIHVIPDILVNQWYFLSSPLPSTGTHRDWPDSRGLYCNTWEGLPAIAVWVNFEDHVSVGK